MISICCQKNISGIVKRIIEKHSRDYTVLICGRWIPNIDLARASVNDNLIEINKTLLRFSSDEITELFANNGIPLSKLQCDQITLYTEGWPAAVKLSVQWASLFDNNTSDLSHWLCGGSNAFLRYVEEEILSSLDERSYQFMLETSPAGQFDLDLAEAIPPSCGPTLSLIKKMGLCEISSSASFPTHHYNPLMAEYLASHLRRLNPLRFRQVHLLCDGTKK